MPGTNQTIPPSIIWKQILTDVHFWIPVAVLLAGLTVLHWIR